MKLLHVVPTYLPAWRHGGPIRAVHGLARALVARGHQVGVFTTNVHGRGTLNVPVSAPVILDGVAVRYFPVSFPRRLYRAPAMAAALRECVAGYDIVHLHSLFLWPTRAAARAAERCRVPYLVSPRGMLVRDLVARRGWLRKTLWLRLCEERTLSRAAAVVVTSAMEAQEARAFGLALPRLVEIPNGIDPSELSQHRDAPVPDAVARTLARQPLLLCLGRLSWKKGLDRLISILPMLPGATLALAGNDDENLTPRLRDVAAKAGVAHRVVFLGPVSGAGKESLLRNATALVLPSLSENFGNVVLEAMACGCPAVVTPEVGLAPVLEASGAGVVTPAEALGATLVTLLADAPRLAAMRVAGPRRVAESFTWDRVAASMEGLYGEVRA